MSDTPRHSVSVAGIVVNEAGQVLVIRRRDNGAWEPPGGVLELDETFDDGVRREVAEETGVAVTVGPLTGIYKNMNRGIVAFTVRDFRGRTVAAYGRAVQRNSAQKLRSVARPRQIHSLPGGTRDRWG